MGMATALAAGLASCSPAAWMPRIEGKLEAELAPSTCDSALALAEDARAAADGTAPANVDSLVSWQRLRRASDASALWQRVAVACPGRFSQGVLASGQMDALAASMASRLGVAHASTRVSIDETTKLSLDSDTVSRLTTAQDRASFAFEILASRNRADSSALLAASDRHKALAAGFAAHGADANARQKVYSVQRLLASPVSIVDDATGLRMSSVAAVTMDLVREQLAALSGEHGDDSTVIADDATAVTLAALLASETADALNYGFPDFDDALFAARGVDES